MNEYADEISVKGRRVKVKAIIAENMNIVVTGKFIKTARIKEEWDSDVKNPSALVAELKSRRAKADIFTFWQRLPKVKPLFNDYHMEWDNIAALPITSYEHWWNEQIRFKARNKFRKVEKLGVNVTVVPFSDELVHGIMGIYNESPVRQGKPFWHYGKDFDTVKRENSTYLDRSDFIGAYYHDELIGFIRLVNYGQFAFIMQIISMMKHRDKAPTNGLIAKAVEVCAQKQIPHLVYAKYVYGSKGADTLTEFKRTSGFERIEIPRYYIPLTLKGKLALRLGLHHSLAELLPKKLVVHLIGMRNKWNEKKYGSRNLQKDD
ncbi:MAG: hypothetical protein IT392_09715 [Nitrospirae bacterium]|nr:hypothetical protein [Nitrospirota bacterium]